MVRRDPQTGKFVSGGGHGLNWHDRTQISGHMHWSIPAADLGGGTLNANATGGPTEIVDFTPVLENDEVYRLSTLHVSAYLGFPTTATAESSGMVSFDINSDGDPIASSGGNPFYEGANDEDGVIDIVHGSTESDSSIYYADLIGEASVGDTVNGVGSGSDYENMTEWIAFDQMLGGGPVYDRDDELYCPVDVRVDNAADHSISGGVSVMLYGHVEELD